MRVQGQEGKNHYVPTVDKSTSTKPKKRNEMTKASGVKLPQKHAESGGYNEHDKNRNSCRTSPQQEEAFERRATNRLEFRLLHFSLFHQVSSKL